MNSEYPRYKYDLAIRLSAGAVGSYIVTQYGGKESFLELLLTPDFYIEFGVTLLFALLIIHLVYYATRILDKRFDWHHRPLWRIPLQILLGIFAPTIVTFLLAAGYFAYYDRNILETNYHIYALPFIVLLITIVNIYYYIRFLLAERSYYRQLSLQQLALYPQTDEDSVAGSPVSGPEIFIARTPTRSVPVPLADIAYFYRSGGHVYLRQLSGKDLLLSQSLDAIAPQLDDKRFFRVARHLIAQRSAIVEYQPLSYGKLVLTLQPAFREEATVSKPLARNFKSWMNLTS